jgi:transglutaminase-like putative cysteine protease
MTGRLPVWLRILLAAVIAALLPAALKLLLRPELSWPLLLALVWAKIALSVFSTRLSGIPPRIFRALSSLYTVGFAATVLTGILITPYSAYGIWFESVRDGEPRGVVSILIVLLAAVFSSSLAHRLLHCEILLPLYGELLIAAGVAALIYQTRFFYLLLLCLLTAGSLVLSFRFVRPPHRLRNLSAFLLLFLALLALSRIPMLFTTPRGSRIVDQQLHPGLRQTVVALFPRFPLLYGIPGFGYGFQTKRLGGTPVLSEAPIFEVRGQPGRRLYLRTSSYATYDGSSWNKRRQAEEPPDQPGTLAAGELSRMKVLGSDEVPGASVRITVLAEYYTLVPFTLDTRSIYLPPGLLEGTSGNFQQGFRLADPLRSGQSIVLETERRFGPGRQSAPASSPEEARAYLQLPDRLTPEIRELAAVLADPASETRRTLRNIERYLAQNYIYNLEAERASLGVDFVDTFLFHSREGYCVHFASSFVVLARLNGIPARYATGFLVNLSDGFPPFDGTEDPGRGTVSGLSAHAWPEVWLEDRGWSAWEATTAVNLSYYDEMGEGLVYEYDRVENRLTNRQLRAILGREPLSQTPKQPWSWPLDWQILLLLGPLLALLFAVWWVLRRYGILVLAALRPDRQSALEVIRKIVSSRNGRDAKSPEAAGWVRWIDQAFPGSHEYRRRAGRLLRVIQKLAYSDSEFRKRDLRFLTAFYRKYCAGPASPW